MTNAAAVVLNCDEDDKGSVPPVPVVFPSVATADKLVFPSVIEVVALAPRVEMPQVTLTSPWSSLALYEVKLEYVVLLVSV